MTPLALDVKQSKRLVELLALPASVTELTAEELISAIENRLADVNGDLQLSRSTGNAAEDAAERAAYNFAANTARRENAARKR